MVELAFYPRYAERLLTAGLEDSPVVLIQGPRQCGKTTLSQMVCAPKRLTWHGRPPSIRVPRRRDYTYVNFDDDDARAGAQADPTGVVQQSPEPTDQDTEAPYRRHGSCLSASWRGPGLALGRPDIDGSTA